MIAVNVYLNAQNDSGVVQVQFAALPRLGETVSITLPGQPEQDLQVVSINHLVKPVEGHLVQIQLDLHAQSQFSEW